MTASVDHIGINVTDFERARKFYTAALAPLGVTVMAEFGDVVGMGEDHPFFWLSNGDPGRVHLAFTAPDRKAVDAFYEAAIAAGGRDNGKPGLRPEYSPNYYAAFVIDADGHNIEAVCRAAE